MVNPPPQGRPRFHRPNAPHMQMPGGQMNPNDPALQGGVQLQRVPVIPWEAYVSTGLQVYKDGKVQPALLQPQPMNTPEEAFQLAQLILASQQRKPGPVNWESVPPEVQRHFQFRDKTAEKPT